MSLWWCLLRQVGALADLFSLRSARCHLVPFDLSSSSSLEVSWLYDWRHPRGCPLGCRILVWSSPSSWEPITYSSLLTYIFWDPSSSTWCHHKQTDNCGKHTGLAGRRHSHGYRCISSHLRAGNSLTFKSRQCQGGEHYWYTAQEKLAAASGPFTLAMGMLTIGTQNNSRGAGQIARHTRVCTDPAGNPSLAPSTQVC